MKKGTSFLAAMAVCTGRGGISFLTSSFPHPGKNMVKNTGRTQKRKYFIFIFENLSQNYFRIPIFRDSLKMLLNP
jgi:hypothetical protein